MFPCNQIHVHGGELGCLKVLKIYIRAPRSWPWLVDADHPGRGGRRLPLHDRGGGVAAAAGQLLLLLKGRLKVLQVR